MSLRPCSSRDVPRTCRKRVRGWPFDWAYKARFATREEAENYPDREPGQNAYLCPNCGVWHLGHKPRLGQRSEPRLLSGAGIHADLQSVINEWRAENE